MSTRGVIYVHSSPTAVCPHVEWAISGVLGSQITLRWTPQQAAPGTLRAECNWRGPAGGSGAIAGALRAWPVVRFEVTEEPSEGVDGQRFCHVPNLGLWHGRTSANGDIVVGEDQLRSVMSGRSQVRGRMHELLGTAWDEDLEPYRFAGDGAPVTLLHQVG
ncbi:MAG TPA: DUF3145 domain-containing protein [Pseudonocardia sp.]|nr:hypothetical protein [Pseudonocardiales bacterium]HEV7787527.1 DUF3145 domain-containing protein [Pseudonocardia sp.]